VVRDSVPRRVVRRDERDAAFSELMDALGTGHGRSIEFGRRSSATTSGEPVASA
jgi:hypothetical protein